MNLRTCSFQIDNLDMNIQVNELNSVENSILTLLQTQHQQDRLVDVTWLQSECSHIGFSHKEFSHGFVRLLMRGHLEPRGEFAYAFIAEKSSGMVKENEALFGSVSTKPAEPRPFVQQQTQEDDADRQLSRAGILLVDDDEDVRCVVKAMLEDADYKVFSVDSGKNAISLFHENHDSIDLLVSDVLMPMMNGSEVYEHLNKLRPGLPTVFISGHPSNIIKHLQEADNVKFLAKPLKQTTLVKTIQDVLHSEARI